MAIKPNKDRDEYDFEIEIDDEANDDWIKAGRLKRKAEAGDVEAKRELRRMNREKLFPYPETV